MGKANVKFTSKEGKIYVNAIFCYNGEQVDVTAPLVRVDKINEPGVYDWIVDFNRGEGDYFSSLIRCDENFKNETCGFVKGLGRLLREGVYISDEFEFESVDYGKDTKELTAKRRRGAIPRQQRAGRRRNLHSPNSLRY